jgi:succinate--hydroxymethylglutarate CoA-transferase
MIAQTPFDATESGEIRLIGPAVKFSGTAASVRSQPPRLGQHTDEVLEELGMDSTQADELRQQGII